MFVIIGFNNVAFMRIKSDRSNGHFLGKYLVNSLPAGISFFKVSNEKSEQYEMSSKLKIKAPE